MTDRPWHWGEKELVRFVAAARVGDIHAIVDVSPGEDLREALQADPAREYQHPWERLLALYLAETYFKHEMDGIVYDYAEFRYFQYDDDGYTEQRIAVDLGMLHSVDDFGLRDPQEAARWWQAALEGPYPEGVREEFTKIAPLLDEQTRARLVPLLTP